MVYFIRQNFNIYGIDCNDEAVNMARVLCKSLNSTYKVENIQPFSIEDNPFTDHFFDAILCINVLHTVKDRLEFFNLLNHLIRLLKTGGFLFLSIQGQIGLTQSTGQRNCMDEKNNGDFHSFYLTEDLLSEVRAHGELMEIEPVKTIIIDDHKSYTYLFFQKKC